MEFKTLQEQMEYETLHKAPTVSKNLGEINMLPAICFVCGFLLGLLGRR